MRKRVIAFLISFALLALAVLIFMAILNAFPSQKCHIKLRNDFDSTIMIITDVKTEPPLEIAAGETMELETERGALIRALRVFPNEAAQRHISKRDCEVQALDASRLFQTFRPLNS